MVQLFHAWQRLPPRGGRIGGRIGGGRAIKSYEFFFLCVYVCRLSRAGVSTHILRGAMLCFLWIAKRVVRAWGGVLRRRIGGIVSYVKLFFRWESGARGGFLTAFEVMLEECV